MAKVLLSIRGILEKISWNLGLGGINVEWGCKQEKSSREGWLANELSKQGGAGKESYISNFNNNVFFLGL